jgi:mannosyltransferase
MPPSIQIFTGRWRTLAGVFIALVVAFGIFLRFETHSALWLDEALTVNRARLPVGDIVASVKQDGSPPLYYFMLHFWMELFGTSDLATRSLSGIIGVATLPVAWLAGNRFGGRTVAWTTLVLLASAPFAVYYATEARMYALSILLSGCGYLALRRAVARPRAGNLVATAVVTAALLYTEYWSLYLIGTVFLWLVAAAWLTRRREVRSGNRFGAWKRNLPAIGAVVVGSLLFIPWIPIFLYQAHHTGTPWAAPPNFSAIVSVVTGFTENQGSLSTLGTTQGRILAVIYFALFALALFGSAEDEVRIQLDLHTRPRPRALSFTVLVTLFAAIAGGLLTASAFTPRYAAVIFLPLLLLVALGTTTLVNLRIRSIIVVIAVIAGLVTSFQNITTQRTEAPSVADVINAHAEPGDVIAFCPDQIGPAVYRLTADSSHYDMTTFPRGTSPAFINWVDYKKVVGAADPRAFGDSLDAKAGLAHRIWLVWEPGYQTYGSKCEDLVNSLLDVRIAKTWVASDGYKYYEPMYLTEYLPRSA